MVPLVRPGESQVAVLVVDLGLEAEVNATDDVVGEEPGSGMPLLQTEVENLSVGPHGGEQTPVASFTNRNYIGPFNNSGQVRRRSVYQAFGSPPGKSGHLGEITRGENWKVRMEFAIIISDFPKI